MKYNKPLVYRTPWNRKNIQLLIKEYPNKSNTQLAELLGLKKVQVDWKAHSLGLKKTRKFRSEITSLTNWTRQPCKYIDEEVKMLLSETRDYAKVAKLTGLTLTSLYSRNCRDWHISFKVWTKSLVKQLKELFPTNLDTFIAQQLGMTAKQIQGKARKLGLLKDKEYRQSVFKKAAEILTRPENHWEASGPDNPKYKLDRTQVLSDRPAELKFTKRKKQIILDRQNNKCSICLYQLRRGYYQFDHIIPICIGGTSDIDNGQALCTFCHKEKTAFERRLTNHFRDTLYQKKEI